MPLEVPAPDIAGVAFRPVADGDYPLLRSLYRSTREHELALTGWPEAERQAFSDSQFALQDAWYRGQYPGAALLVIEKDRAAVGRIYLHESPGELRIMDITLAPGMRNHGLGTALFTWLISWAARGRRDVTLHVEAENPARRLYARLGFIDEGVDGLYNRMRWKPPTGG
jgi:RimJ/RimL family protein N-acetyltransferase